MLERGRLLNSSGKGEDSKRYFLEAFELAQDTREEFLAIDAAHTMGIVEPAQRQLEWSLRALVLARNAGDARARNWEGSLQNNIGWSYHDAGQCGHALEHFQSAYTWHQDRDNQRETRIAAWTVARCLRSLGRVEEALRMQQHNLEKAQDSSEPTGFVEEELGECLYALSRPEEAALHYERAHSELAQDAWLVANESERLGRLRRLSRR